MINFAKIREHMFDVVGAIHEVHRELGPGLNEYCYQEALQMELEEEAIPFKREFSFHPTYHGRVMEAAYRVDFLCKDDIIVECKVAVELSSVHRAQLYNYMRLLRKPCGILVNFAPKFATIERYFYDVESSNILGVDGRVIQKVV